MPYIVGSPIFGFCKKCADDTQHIVIKLSGERVNKVRCNTCGYEGILKPAKTITFPEAEDKKTDKKKKKTKKAKSHEPPTEIVFDKLVADMEKDDAVKYNMKKELSEGQLIKHKVFGLGLVTSITDSNKAAVFFKEGPKIMAFNLNN